MVDIRQQRRLILLVPSPQGDAVLAQGSRLPRLDCELAAADTTIQAAARALADLGLVGPILECAIDQTPGDQLGSEPRTAVVQLAAPPPEWQLPPDLGWGWLPWAELDAQVLAPLADVAATRIGELTGSAAVPALRAEWSRPGWYERATKWINHALQLAGREPADSIVQIRHWGISALMRVEAPDGRTWFKASFPPFHTEVPISMALAELAPDATGQVVGGDTRNGWLLLNEFEGTTDATDRETAKRAVDHLVGLQKSMLPHASALRDAGCVDRPLSQLASDLQTSFEADTVVTQLDLTPALVVELVDAAAEAAAGIESIGLPDTLVHGDFHPGNVAVTNDSVVLFDWSDGAISSPVIDVAVWAWWHEDNDAKRAELWEIFCTAWQREFAVDVSALRSTDVDVVAGAYHLVSYERILTALESTERPSHADGLDYFFGLLKRGNAHRPSP